MCGIAGKLSADGAPELGVVEKMVAKLRHRGPDHRAVRDLGGAVLGHARLSIIDLDPRAHQPMTDPAGRYSISYNGEVYNFRELRAELLARGHAFRTSSDTEVVLHAYAAWGADALARFNGMFALAIWDAEERELFLARDRFGKKPLYYTELGGGFAFASELDSLLEDPAVRERARVSVEGLNHYFALGYVLAPATLVAGVHKLEPASYLRVRAGRVGRPTRYWEYRDAFARRPRTERERDVAADLAALLEQAVARRLVSDVPVGSFLSGGLDSSSVVAFARKHLSYGLHTFSVGFEAASYDESADARVVSDRLGTIHHECLLGQSDGRRIIDRAIDKYDEAFSDTSLVPMVEVSRVAAEHVKVVLSGDGADEILAGYPTYQADWIKRGLDVFPARARAGAACLLSRFARPSHRKTGLGFKAHQFAGGLAGDARFGHYAWRELHREAERIALIGAEHADEVRETHPFNVFARYYDEVGDLDPLAQHLYVDAKTWLADDVLVKVDRATMAWSIEARTPYLDPDLVEYVAALPASLKLRWGRGKHILRAALRPHLPRHTITKRKAGFNAPIRAWLGPGGTDHEFRLFNRYVWARRPESRMSIECSRPTR